jgi:hypothetical protein
VYGSRKRRLQPKYTPLPHQENNLTIYKIRRKHKKKISDRFEFHISATQEILPLRIHHLLHGQ